MTICKIIVWNNNFQKRCPERQFPKVWPKRPLTEKSCPGQQFINKKSIVQNDIYIKKSWPERKFAEKGVQNTNLKNIVQNDYLRKTSCQEQQYAEFAKKMTCHNYLLKLCNIYQVDKYKIRIL